MDRSLKKVGNEIIVLTPVIDVFSPNFKMKSTAEDYLQEEVIEGQNGAVVLDGAAPLHRYGQLGVEGGHCHRTHRTPHRAVRLLHGLLHESDQRGCIAFVIHIEPT